MQIEFKSTHCRRANPMPRHQHSLVSKRSALYGQSRDMCDATKLIDAVKLTIEPGFKHADDLAETKLEHDEVVAIPSTPLR